MFVCYILFLISRLINCLMYSDNDIPSLSAYIRTWFFKSSLSLSFIFSFFGSDVVLINQLHSVNVGQIKLLSVARGTK